MAGATIYCIDTSSLIEAHERRYPPKNFKTLWKRLDELVQAERLIAPEAVLDELEKKAAGELFGWAKAWRAELVVPIDDPQQLAVARILSEFPRLVESGKNRSGGDPWVIALAQTRGASVVTEESPTAKNKIPSVCAAYRIACVNLLGVVQAEDWVF